MAVIPMFPLGSVLFPSLVLPLHVFEPRYREMTRDCLAGDREFGVVLIERGSEVGGGDVRASVGTVARIVEAVEMPDGRWALGAVGTRRVRVDRWLADDPYPRAEVSDYDEPEPPEHLAEALDVVVAQLRRVLAVRAELGDPGTSATQELAEDPVLASYQAAALSPLGPADQQRLLAIGDAAGRVRALHAALTEEEAVLEARVRWLTEDPGSSWEPGAEG